MAARAEASFHSSSCKLKPRSTPVPANSSQEVANIRLRRITRKYAMESQLEVLCLVIQIGCRGRDADLAEQIIAVPIIPDFGDPAVDHAEAACAAHLKMFSGRTHQAVAPA